MKNSIKKNIKNSINFFIKIQFKKILKIQFSCYRRGAQVRPGAFFTAGSGQIQLDNVVCRGNETNIAFCRHRPWKTNNCDHTEDVGVVCGQGEFIIKGTATRFNQTSCSYCPFLTQ